MVLEVAARLEYDVVHSSLPAAQPMVVVCLDRPCRSASPAFLAWLVVDNCILREKKFLDTSLNRDKRKYCTVLWH